MSIIAISKVNPAYIRVMRNLYVTPEILEHVTTGLQSNTQINNKLYLNSDIYYI